ncbi:receptor-like protein 13 [Jatropha curcas]|uniref:receptor-like protein 13 n=1 Tax=Jatropha curcas TaxID=180498 RepID=UPI001895FEC1|nr:receptor-like protein 13 [Jatropha curcas]
MINLIAFTGFCGLNPLEELDLSSNMFGGNLPRCLHNLTSVRYLDLSLNNFTGHVPSSWISRLKSLKYIDLRQNLFDGSFSFTLFANHSHLEVVDFSDNKIEVETKYSGWVPPFQLKVLVLKNCHLSRIPEFLHHQFRLKMVDLSNNKIHQRFATWLLDNNTELAHLILKNNSFIGPFHLPLNSSFNISSLDVSDNYFNAQLQEIGEKMFPNIEFLNLSKNHLQGDFLFSPGDNCKLRSLDLSFNNFSGEVPEKMISSCTSLQILKLSHNNFHGEIFTAFHGEIFTARFNLTSLWSLNLNDNSFMGTLSRVSVTQFSYLSVLDLSNNRFHGEIPHWMNNITYLFHVNLSHNSFRGEVSCEFFSAIYVDLSYNNFSGSLPSCFNQIPSEFRETRYINMQGNRLTGSIPDDFLNKSGLLVLNLKDNNLSSSIPNKFGTFPGTFPKLRLWALLLGGNYLNGFVPNWLCELNELNFLDLSRNSFSGSIPNCLYNLSFGRTKVDGDLFETQLVFGSIQFGLYFSGDALDIYQLYGEQRNYIIVDPKIEFVTKYMPYNFKGHILNLMSGLDLSQNKLTGEIPFDLGKLFQIHALNLSYNQLIGSIPETFSNLTALESLDLSYNHLSGEIPYGLADLDSLGAFSVAHNNLSGRIPDERHLSTFDNRSFEGNPFLCGSQVEKKCNHESLNSSPMPYAEPEDGKWYEIDHLVFFVSFTVSFAIFFMGVITILHVNPYWRGRLFHHAEQFVLSCYYFVHDTVSKLLFGRLFH